MRDDQDVALGERPGVVSEPLGDQTCEIVPGRDLGQAVEGGCAQHGESSACVRGARSDSLASTARSSGVSTSSASDGSSTT